MRAWVLTDGDSDDETRCLGVAEALADEIERRRVAPRAPWRWLAPFGPIDPLEASDVFGGPITARKGWPDVAIAAGRRAVAYLTELKRASSQRTVTAFIGETLAGPRVADVVAVTTGSRLRGANVVRTPTRPHRMSVVRLLAARAGPPLAPDAPPGPRVAVLLGHGAGWPREDAERLLGGLRRLREAGAALLCAGRRRGREEGGSLDMAAREVAHYMWDRKSPDPRAALLARSDAFVASADDPLSVEEAVATGRPVLTFRPSRLGRADAALVDRLERLGATRPFAGRLEQYSYAALDSTPEIARAISAVAATRAALAPATLRRTPARSRETNGPTPR